MADTNFRGPVSSMGSLEYQSGTTATVEGLDGPSMFYQGIALPNLRSGAFAKDIDRPGQQSAELIIPTMYGMDAIPQARATNIVSAIASSVMTSGTGITLATVQQAGVASAANLAVAIPFLPAGATTPVNVIALDFGFTTGTTVANSSTVTVVDNSLFSIGQWLCIPGVGNSSSTLALFTQVQSITTGNTTTITVGANLPATAISNVPIGAANLFGSGLLPLATQFGPGAPTPTTNSISLVAGLAKVTNPRQMLARNISISGLTTVAMTAVVTGYDVWGQKMTELITVGATTVATTAYGQKAFKYIQSIVPGTTDGTNKYSIGVGDVFGMPFRMDEAEQTQVWWNGCLVTTKSGFSTAPLSAQTLTTLDPRGTVQVSTTGGGSAITVATAALTNGTSRLVVIQNPGVWNVVSATPNNLVPMFGQAQYSATT